MALQRMILIPCDSNIEAKRQQTFDQCKNRYSNQVTIACMDGQNYILHPAHRNYCMLGSSPDLFVATCFMEVVP
jgi:hypothetical protein